MAEASAGVRLRVFTHPACAGCPQVVERAWKLTRAHPDVELRTVSLEQAEGLAEAQAEGVRTIPTLILEGAGSEPRRWSGTPAAGELEAAVEAMTA